MNIVDISVIIDSIVNIVYIVIIILVGDIVIIMEICDFFIVISIEID